MTIRRFARGLVTLLLFHPAIAHATTAVSLSQRMQLDGNVDEYAADEWILDALSPFPEPAGDSRWGNDDDVSCVALTWDAGRAYLAVQFTAQASAVLVLIGNGPGGVASLDATGEFRRAIDLPFDTNLLVLATPHDTPRVARADASHAFALVDDATVPVRVAVRADTVALEAWIPWTLLDPSRPVRVTVLTTGDTGSGAGDAAPDPRAVLSGNRYTRAVIDRCFHILADSDGDGSADAGIAPRSAGTVDPDTAPTGNAVNDGIDVSVSRGVFAPERGETVQFDVRARAGTLDAISGRCVIYAMDGRRIRTFAIPETGAVSEVSVTWDGRDDSGVACNGGVYVAAFQLDYSTAGARGHANPRVGVALAQ